MMATCNRQGVIPVALGAVSPLPVYNTGLYTATVLESMDAFRDIRREWEILFDDTQEVSANLDFGWLNAWLENFFTGRLFVVIVRDGSGRLVGAAPFKIARPRSGLNRRVLRHLQFIGTEPCLYDEMKILIHPQENPEAILEEIAHQLIRHHKAWDVIDLRYCPNEEQLQILSRLLSPVVFQGDTHEVMTSPYFRLPQTMEKYRDDYRKNTTKLRQYRNKIHREFPGAELRLVQFESGPELDRQIDMLAERHIRYWKDRGVVSNFSRYPQMKKFYRDLLAAYPASKKSGRVCAHFSALMLDDEVVSQDLGLGQRDGYISLMPCYDEQFRRYSPGFILSEALIEQGITRGDRHYYMGRGDENYKHQWCDQAMTLHNMRLFRSRHAALMWQCDDTLKKLLGRGPSC